MNYHKSDDELIETETFDRSDEVHEEDIRSLDVKPSPNKFDVEGTAERLRIAHEVRMQRRAQNE